VRIALIDSNRVRPADRGQHFYPIALLKIGAWLKSQGHQVKLFDNRIPKSGFSEVWVTTLFTYDIPYSAGLVREAATRFKKVRVGGVAASLLPRYFEPYAEVHVGLMPEVEQFSPDYSLLPEPPEYSVTHITRGCIRKCAFCMVPKLEPVFRRRKRWQDDLAPGARKIYFYDNNWLAQSIKNIRQDVADILEVMDTRGIQSVDFNQALDARILTEEKAEELCKLTFDPGLRFAFDSMEEDGYWQEAVRMCAARGQKHFTTYVLYNFTDKPRDLYYRLKEHVRIAEELGLQMAAFPMRYHPILEIDSGRNFVGKYWTRRQRDNLGALVGRVFQGNVSCKGDAVFPPVKQFENWFGATAEEFIRLLDYPNFRKLIRRKTAKHRLDAYRAREAKHGTND
jgi:hypothetical protein